MAKRKRVNNRAKPDNEPQAELFDEAPPAPDRLGEHGKAYWERITPLLVDQHLLTKLDLEALEAMCHWWNEYITWQVKIQDDPKLAVISYPGGARQKSPESTFRDNAYTNFLKLVPRFGLTPENMRKVKKLNGPSTAGASSGVDPISAFASQKYEDE